MDVVVLRSIKLNLPGYLLVLIEMVLLSSLCTEILKSTSYSTSVGRFLLFSDT